jgi:hypothetical protein
MKKLPEYKQDMNNREMITVIPLTDSYQSEITGPGQFFLWYILPCNEPLIDNSHRKL